MYSEDYPRKELPCNTNPAAPHGFDRTASHMNGCYTCECAGWVDPAIDFNKRLAEKDKRIEFLEFELARLGGWVPDASTGRFAVHYAIQAMRQSINAMGEAEAELARESMQSAIAMCQGATDLNDHLMVIPKSSYFAMEAQINGLQAVLEAARSILSAATNAAPKGD